MPHGAASADPVGEFVTAFNEADFATMRSLLADDLVASVTNADGTESTVTGASAYVDSLRGLLELPDATCRISLTQAPVVVRPGWILVMLEIGRRGRARRCTTSLRSCSVSRPGGSPRSG